MRGSITALVTAFVRAYHAPRVFDDYLADRLFDPQERAGLAHNLGLAAAAFEPGGAGDLATFMRQPSSAVTLPRSAYMEACVRSGQYVLLGAGLDTCAYRRPELEVFEVDLPATQADKRERLKRLGPEPANLRFVPFDFGEGELAAALAGAGFRRDEPAVFAWPGVSYYLPAERVTATLGAIADLAAPGSRLAFDYLDPAGLVAPELAVLRAILERTGEPFRSGFDPAELAGLGWRLVERLGPAEIQARYFDPELPGYRAFAHVHFALAERA